ncbi:hypothetical protein VTJ04DRAFT_7623 [Mycothermus thermophilus]|uniref:uncharacterized protein n=1 Tax=Humicola insolens TaxID=85995 RepID=UPI0037443952
MGMYGRHGWLALRPGRKRIVDWEMAFFSNQTRDHRHGSETCWMQDRDRTEEGGIRGCRSQTFQSGVTDQIPMQGKL